MARRQSRNFSFGDEDLQTFVKQYKISTARDTSNAMNSADERVYVNRTVNMDKIKFIGFDMDYTLVDYKSPEYEILAFDMLIKRLIDIGYPEELSQLQYDANFPLRGLYFDRTYGNLLKVDGFGNILRCIHGFDHVHGSEIERLYPNKYVQASEDRFFILNTLFHLPETFIIAALINYFDHHPDYEKTPNGVQCGSLLLSYKSIHQDLRNAVDWAHMEGELKRQTLKNLDKYVIKEPRLPSYLDHLHKSGSKVFLVTNSDFTYTERLLTYMFDQPGQSKPWKSYFDYIIVDARKPLFFQEGTMLKEINEETGSLKIGTFTGNLQKGKVYSGGSSALFCKLTGAHGKEILYVGDHIFGDIIKSKKEQAWRTFLVIPELTKEVAVWESTSQLYTKLLNLEFILAEMFRTTEKIHMMTKLPEISALRKEIKETARAMEQNYPSKLGSLLRSDAS
ncbi:cytosolic purine 5'-nucleotidase-like isoform X2 [Dysidea avara]|uniref:cytosolic purine 5'-nucleotidase-like isoform X2 n=1 Tax=Dysidea avara TaxID=196820 RepID=UPI00332EBBBD